VSVTVVGGYRALPPRLTATTRRANSAKIWRSRTPARLYLYDTILQRLAQGFEDMAAELRQFIQDEHPVLREGHLTRYRPVAAADQPPVREGVMGGPKGAGGHQRRALPGEAGHTVDARGLDGFSQAHGWQDGGEAPGQHRFARPWRSQEEDVVTALRPAFLSLPAQLESAESYILLMRSACRNHPTAENACQQFPYRVVFG
jgi:hypothetical protein